jgi:hypothetical protein
LADAIMRDLNIAYAIICTHQKDTKKGQFHA